jgi:hypothetical protein
MTTQIDLLQESIFRLKNSVQTLNRPAYIEGLLAKHFCSNYMPEDHHEWQVYKNVDHWQAENASTSDQAPYMAVLGSLLAEASELGLSVQKETIQQFEKSINRLMQRKDIFQSTTSWIFQPAIVLCIALGIRTTNSEILKKWLLSILDNGSQANRATLFHKLSFTYAAALIGKTERTLFFITDMETCSLPELGLAIWLANRSIITIENLECLENAEAFLLSKLIGGGLKNSEVDFKYAIILDVVLNYITTRSHLPSDELLLSILKRFEPAMERWQHKWQIKDEYDIQSVLWLILRPYFPDIRYEETLAKLGRAAHRFDFGIPTIGTLIEVKYIRKKEDFQKIVYEVGIDSVQVKSQSQYRTIIVFAYDEVSAIENHDWARESLLHLDLVKDAIFVSSPSFLRLTNK